MVKGPLRLLAIIILVLPVSACIFVMSVFPATLSQIVARADLSAVIPAGAGFQYQAYIVTPTGGEFVILLNRNSSMDPAAVIMDSDLHLIQTYTLSQYSTWLITSGSTLMTDAHGYVALKDHYFSAADLTTINQAPSGSMGGAMLNGPSFSSPAASKNEINFQISGSFYEQHGGLWGLNFTSGVVLVNGAGGNYQVEAVYNVDDTPSAGEVVLVLDDMGSSNSYFVAIPLADILADGVASPLFSNYPHKTLSNVDSSSIGFAGDSLVAYSNDSNSFKRYSVTPPFNEIGSLSADKSKSQLQYAYKMTGGYYVVYDQNARTLTKVANWW